MSQHPALDRARNFADDLTQLVQAVFPSSLVFQARVDETEKRVQLSPLTASGGVAALPLFIDGQKVASWKLSMLLDLDRSRKYLKVIKSNFSLSSDVDSTPLVRYEFDDGMRTAPVAHWQFHGERGAFSYLLGLAKAAGREAKPHSLSSVHFPVGGSRLRPGVGDLLQFMVRECGFDTVSGWERAVLADRESYRAIQAKTVVRDMQEEAAEVLQAEGWTVSPPPDYKAKRGTRLTQDW